MTARVAGARRPAAAAGARAPRPSSAASTSTATGSSKPPAAKSSPAAAPSSARRPPATTGGRGKSSSISPTGRGPARGKKAPAKPSLGTRLQGPAPVRQWLGTRPPSRTPRQAKAHAVAGGLLGLAAYAMFINGIRYGPSGMSGWLKAKFLNKPMQGLPVVDPNQPVQKPTGGATT